MDALLRTKILTDFHLQGLSTEDQEEAIRNIGEIMFQKLILRIADELSEEERSKLLELMGAGSPDEIQGFLVDKIPNLDLLMKHELEELKQENDEFLRSVTGE